MASEGLGLALIATGLGISYDTLRVARAKYPAISVALEEGGFELIRPIAQKVITVAKSGKDMRTSLAVLRAKGGWRDQIQVTTPTGQPFEVAHRPLDRKEAESIQEVLDASLANKRD